ncbi:MAG: dienelactone hydrolase family protein [Burkholderiales bacterium]|nr:dienelactone hydrolase family protein [Burkholderiales bacterium]
MLNALEIATGPEPTAAVIWLHGLGADGNDFAPIVPELDLPPAPIRFVFPHAPAMPVTINGGYVMPAWYDILGTDINRREDEAGVRASQKAVEELIAREAERGIAPSRIVLAGFSQGGAIAFQTALRRSQPLAGVMALSTYVPLAATLAAERSAASNGVPIFMAHGTYDPIIPLATAQRSRDLLQGLGYAVEWHEYPMEHSVCPEEIAAIGAFLKKTLG